MAVLAAGIAPPEKGRAVQEDGSQQEAPAQRDAQRNNAQHLRVPPAGPPPPTPAVARLQARKVPASLRTVAELHEMHSELRELAAPARDGHMPLTLLTAGHCREGRHLPVLQQSPELRGLFGAWLRSLAGDEDGYSSAWGGRLSVDMWIAQCVNSRWQPLGEPCDDATPGDSWPRCLVASDGVVAGALRHSLASVNDGVEILAHALSEASEEASFVAVGVELRRYVAELGSTALVSALWVDIAAREFAQESICLQSLSGFLSNGGADPNLTDDGSGYASPLAARPEVRGEPLLALLSPALRGEWALALVVIGPHDAEARTSATRGAAELAERLVEHVPSASPLRQVEATAVREGFAKGRSSGASAIPSFSTFAGCFRDICDPPSSPMKELLRGDVSVKSYGFPGQTLPSLNPYLSRFTLTASDRKVLMAAAEAEIAEFEKNGWFVQRPGENIDGNGIDESVPWSTARPTGFGDVRVPSPLYVHLADCYTLPEANLTTTIARSYCRSQDSADPMVRTIRRLREDVGLAVALLPICGAHPFNPVRLLRLGGVHSLLALLSDASALAPGHEEGKLAPAVDALAPAEIGALVLAAFASFAPIRRFLVSQCILELLAVAIRHPASDRHLLIFTALLTRLCRDPEHRLAAAEAVSPALAEQIPKLVIRGGNGRVLAEALLAAAASLSPFLPAQVFEPVLQNLLAHLTASASPAYHHFACSLACSLRRSGDVDLGTFVPRLLSLVPIQAPAAADFHGGAAALLALCSHTAATTSLSRRWVAAAAIAVVRRALRSGPAGLASIYTAVPLAAAQESGDEKLQKDKGNEWYCEVEEEISLQSTLRWTHGNLSSTLGSIGNGTFRPSSTASKFRPSSTPQVPLREQHLHGWTQLLKSEDLAGSPNTALFHEGPQLRIVVPEHREKTEIFISIALLPATHCEKPLSACGCAWGGDSEGCGGQLGIWLCELPEESALNANEVRSWRHQLDLRPPLHASAAAPGQTEHFVSVTVPCGSYTLIPFTSHTTSASSSSTARSICRSSSCGCVDVNLMQEPLWERSRDFTSVSIWAECTELNVSKVLPNSLRLAVTGELLMQSVPLWLQVPADSCRTEVLLCLSSDCTDALSLRGSEPSLDLWPLVPHRRVRNERTGALRIHIPELLPGEPLRASCLWQEGIVPSEWHRSSPRLMIYASSQLTLHTPPPCPIYPALKCKPPDDQLHRWQAAMLLSGGWTPGFSSGFGNLRNPQVILEVPHSPGRAEELQLDFYLSIPVEPGDDRKRPTAALTVFTRNEQQLPAAGPPERLLEGQLRKELGSSKAVIGGYVTAQLALSGSDARQPLFVVLQNSEPQETFPWQLRILARIRPCSHATNGKLISNAEAQIDDNARMYEGEVPDDPPIRCAVVGGTAAVNRIYACWPDSLALYIPKPSRGESTTGFSERVTAWVQSRRAWCKGELLQITSALGPSTAPAVVPWPAPEILTIPDDEMRIRRTAAVGPSSMLAGQQKVRSNSEKVTAKSNAAADSAEDANKVQLTSSRRVPPKPQVSSAVETNPNPNVPQQPSPPNHARATQSGERGFGEPRQWRRGGQADTSGPSEVSSAHSERHARVEALLRRRRQGLGYDSPRADIAETSSLPTSQEGIDRANKPPIVNSSSERASSSRPPVPRRNEANREGAHGYSSHSFDAEHKGEYSAGIVMPQPPAAASQGFQASPGTFREGRHRPAATALPPAQCEEVAERRSRPSTPPKDASTPKGTPPAQSALPVTLPQLRPPISQKMPAGPSVCDRGGADAEEKGRCCHFAGHPIFCCRAEVKRSKGPTRHIVKLERRPGADRLGFGNVAAGPKDAPVLVISWVREGALAVWNETAPEGLRVPPQSAIVSVNGVASDVQAMREQLRCQQVEMEVIAPDRWRWNQVVSAG